MKKIKYILSVLLGILLITSLQSCTDDFGEMNTDPQLVNRDAAEPGMLFTQSVRSGVFEIPQHGVIKEFSGLNVSQSSGHIFNERRHSDPFEDMMTNDLVTVSEMIRMTEDNPAHANTNAIGRIWKVWLFQQITDAFGDIPYSEAVLSQEEAINTPKYDTQEEIYNDFFVQLEQAAADLQESEERVSLGSQDLIYGGDIDLWRRFANSLRLRYALRVRFVDETLAQQQIDNVINEPLIEDNSQNAQVITQGENTAHTSNRHPLYNTMSGGPLNPLTCSHTVVGNMLAGGSEDLDMDDPRLPKLCDPAQTDGAFRGNLINRLDGFRSFHSNDNVSHLSEFAWRSEQPIVILDHAEVQFNIAEARLAGFASGDPQEAYEEGIRSAMEFYEVDDADISAFLNSSAGTLSGSDEDKLRQISTQRYLSFFQQTMEAWNEWRRTGYPIIYVSFVRPGHTGDEVPRRVIYPDSEISTNRAQVEQAVDRLGGDNYMSRIWWDAREGLPFTHPHDGIFPPPPDEPM